MPGEQACAALVANVLGNSETVERFRSSGAEVAAAMSMSRSSGTSWPGFLLMGAEYADICGLSTVFICHRRTLPRYVLMPRLSRRPLLLAPVGVDVHRSLCGFRQALLRGLVSGGLAALLVVAWGKFR